MHKVIANKDGGIKVPLTDKEVLDKKQEEAQEALNQQAKETSINEKKLIKQNIISKLGISREDLSILINEKI